MKRTKPSVLSATVCGWLCGLAIIANAQAPAAPPAVPATIRVKDKDSMKVVVSNFEGGKLFYRSPDAGMNGASISIPEASLEEFSFDLTLDETEVNRALMNQDWRGACQLLLPAISPLLPYLGIKDNNAADLAMTLGNSLLKTANAMRTGNSDDERALRLIQRAHEIFSALAKATWFQESETARLKSILCLVTLKKIKQADQELKSARIPEIGDLTLGLYWLIQANLRETRGDNQGAMNAVVKSLAFENKDIETFPDALMLSGRLYEALKDPYRPRDVYYEVARLFPNTDWAKTATARLQDIMTRRLTQTNETAAIEQTFFGSVEDINSKASALLKGTLDGDKPEPETKLEEPAAGSSTPAPESTEKTK